MNKVIVTLLLLLSASAVTPAWSSKTSVSMKGDTTTVIEDGDTMTISAERHSEHEEKDKSGNYMRCERSYGSYQRSFDISAVNADAMTAEYTDGVLKLTMPKKEMTVTSAKRLEIR